MRNYENTFVRGPSPSYSDEGASAFSSNPTQFNTDNSLDEKCAGSSVCEGAAVKHQGRNTFAFWTVVVVLLILTVGNLMITLTIIGVLHLGKGIRGMELIPEEDVIKFDGSTDLDYIFMKGDGSPQSGQINGFIDVPVSIAADKKGVFLLFLQHSNGQYYEHLVMDKGGIQFGALNNFEIKDPDNMAKTIFTTHRPRYNMPNGAENLIAKTISASRIASSLEHSLNVEADNRIGIKGSEGIFVDGKNILLQAEQSININGSQTILEGGAGIFLDMNKIPIVSPEYGLRTGSVQFKICVCMPQGTLFRIAIPRVHNGPKITCAHFSSLVDPCATN